MFLGKVARLNPPVEFLHAPSVPGASGFQPYGDVELGGSAPRRGGKYHRGFFICWTRSANHSAGDAIRGCRSHAPNEPGQFHIEAMSGLGALTRGPRHFCRRLSEDCFKKFDAKACVVVTFALVMVVSGWDKLFPPWQPHHRQPHLFGEAVALLPWGVMRSAKHHHWHRTP